MEEKIKSLKKEAEEITLFLADPNAYMSEDFASKSKRLAEINEIIEIDEKIRGRARYSLYPRGKIRA